MQSNSEKQGAISKSLMKLTMINLKWMWTQDTIQRTKK